MTSTELYVFRNSNEFERESNTSQELSETEEGEAELEQKEISIVPNPFTLMTFKVVIGSNECGKWKFIKDYLSSNDYLDLGNMSRIVQVGNENCLIRMTSDEGLENCWGSLDRTIRNANGFIFLYKTSSRESLSIFPLEREAIVQHKQADKLPFLIIAINEEDRSSSPRSIVSEEEGRKVAESYGCLFRTLSKNKDTKDFIDNIVHEFAKNILDYGQPQGDLLAFVEAPNIFEVVCAGDVFVGKTSFISRLLTGSYPKAYRTTGTKINHMIKLPIKEESDSCLIKLVDTPGLTFLETLGKETLLSTNAFVLFYSITSRVSFNEVEKLRTKILSLSAKHPTLIVGTKSDKSSERQVTTKEGEALAKRLGCIWGNEISIETPNPEETLVPLINEIRSTFKHNGIELPELDRTGLLYRLGRRGWKPVFTTLINFSLSYVKGEKLTRNTLRSGKKFDLSETGTTMQLASATPLQPLSPSVKNEELFAFAITNSKGSLNLAASSEEERESWMNTIKANLTLIDLVNYLIGDELKSLAQEQIPYKRFKKKSTLSILQKYSKIAQTDEQPKLVRKTSGNFYGPKEDSKRILRRTVSSASDLQNSPFANLRKSVKIKISPLSKRKASGKFSFNKFNISYKPVWKHACKKYKCFGGFERLK